MPLNEPNKDDQNGGKSQKQIDIYFFITQTFDY